MIINANVQYFYRFFYLSGKVNEGELYYFCVVDKLTKVVIGILTGKWVSCIDVMVVFLLSAAVFLHFGNVQIRQDRAL